jgi:branched-chain amino acid transport system ATP-binding protein
MLKIRNLVVKHKQIEAVKGVSFHVAHKEIVTLIGSNGAGKTSLLEAIVGLNKNTEGEIIFGDKDISRANCDEIVCSGISLVPEGRQVFNSMSVKDNLILGAYSRLKKEKKSAIETDFIYEIFPILKSRSHIIRRRTADACDRPGAYGEAESASS